MVKKTSVKVGDRFLLTDLSNRYPMTAYALTDSFCFKPNGEDEEIEYVVIKKTHRTGGVTIDLRRVSDLTKQKEIKSLDWD